MGDLKHILITGANGFLGSNIVEHLLAAGCRPVVLVRETSDLWRIQQFAGQFDIYTISAQDARFTELFSLYPIEAIIHTATNYGRSGSLVDILDTNVMFPLQLIETGLKHQLKLFINTDSFFAKPAFNQAYLNDYTNSKRILFGLLQGFSDKLKIANLRIEHVYGPNDGEQKFVTAICKQLLAHQPEILLTEGYQKRDFVYVKDVAHAFIQVLKRYDQLESFEEFEIGTGTSITVREFVQQMAAATNSSAELRFGALEARKGEIQDSFARLDMNSKINWKASYSMELALQNMIETEKKRFSI